MVYLGFSVAATVRVGTAIGAGSPEKARIAAEVSFMVVFFSSVAAAVTMLALRSHFGSIFVDDKAIIDSVTKASG